MPATFGRVLIAAGRRASPCSRMWRVARRVEHQAIEGASIVPGDGSRRRRRGACDVAVFNGVDASHTS
jgi:hypothetical protein